MPVTLAQATVGMANKTDQKVIDTIRKNSRLMDKLTFDDDQAPGTGGATLTYSYTQLLTPGEAHGRKINTEYTPAEATRTTKHTNLVILGGSYQIDRVIAKNTSKAINEVAFQNEQKAVATAQRFQYLAIHGDYTTSAATNDPEFDGLDVLLNGTANDFDASATGNVIDLSGTMTEAKAEAIAEQLDIVNASVMGGKPDAYFVNSRLKAKLLAAARKLGYYSQSPDGFGKQADYYNGIEIIDLQEYSNGATTVDVIPVTGGKTNLYAVRFGMDALHGVTPTGTGVGLETHLPNFNDAGAVKTGDVEMVVGLVLKNTRTCARIKDIKIA